MAITGEVNRRTSVEEKGQRPAHTPHIFMQPKQDAVCTSCGAVFMNKRWYVDDSALRKAGKDLPSLKVRCPGCELVAEGRAASVATFSGDYLKTHFDTIMDAIKKTELRSREKNPLGRIIDITQEADSITITTTEDKLAQKLARTVHKAHAGDLEYQWGHDDRFVRVFWKRD